MMRESVADEPPHGGFGGAVGFRHRIEDAAGRLVLHGERGAKERHDGLARHFGEALDKRNEIDRRHPTAPSVREKSAE